LKPPENLAVSRMTDFWVVLVNFNGLEDTRKCLRSLQESRYTRQSVVLVDNASVEDPTPVLREEFPWCHFVRNSVNGGWAGGNNTGIRYALERGAEQILLLNNDTTVVPELAESLLVAAEAYPTFGILGPVIFFMDEPAKVMTDGCVFNRPGYPGFFERKPVPLFATEAPVVEDVDIVNGCAMMIRADVFRRIGLIDERFFLIHEESDFCLRARQAGFRCGVLNRGLVWHKGSSAFKRSGKRWQRYYDARNLALLLNKHRVRHRKGRGPWRSRLEYLKYVFYRYAVEREEGHDDAAEAVLEGVSDAMTGRYGPYGSAPRMALSFIRRAFAFWFNRCARRASRKEAAGAPFVR
jgi:GT2 family glycosyltransferase